MWGWCCLRTGLWTTCWAVSTAPGNGKTFEGVIGKELSNPIPAWAEHGAGRKVVPYGVAAGMDSPNPDSGEEWYHVNAPAGRSMIVTPRCSVRVWSAIIYVGQPWPG
jgi:hypothetical protein